MGLETFAQRHINVSTGFVFSGVHALLLRARGKVDKGYSEALKTRSTPGANMDLRVFSGRNSSGLSMSLELDGHSVDKHHEEMGIISIVCNS